MDRAAKVAHWVASADHDFVTMQHLFESGDYAWALFVGHLVIEKLLKAYYIKLYDQEAPLIHNLLRLARLDGIEPNAQQIEALSTVTTFNLEARYRDYKLDFYLRCTRAFRFSFDARKLLDSVSC